MEAEDVMWKTIYHRLQSQKSQDATEHELRYLHLNFLKKATELLMKLKLIRKFMWVILINTSLPTYNQFLQIWEDKGTIHIYKNKSFLFFKYLLKIIVSSSK